MKASKSDAGLKSYSFHLVDDAETMVSGSQRQLTATAPAVPRSLYLLFVLPLASAAAIQVWRRRLRLRSARVLATA